MDSILKSYLEGVPTAPDAIQRALTLKSILADQYEVNYLMDAYCGGSLIGAYAFPNQDNLAATQCFYSPELPDDPNTRYWRKCAALLMSGYSDVCTIEEVHNLRLDLAGKLNAIIKAIETCGFRYFPKESFSGICPLRDEGETWFHVFFEEI